MDSVMAPLRQAGELMVETYLPRLMSGKTML
jgi:hypothetical protein